MARHHPLFKDLSEIVGESNVIDDPVLLAAYSQDASLLPPHYPELVVRPGSVEEVVEVVKLANRTKTPIIPTGGRASMCGASLPLKGGITLDLTRLNKVLDVDEANLKATVECGITWGALLHELAKVGYEPCFKGPYSGHAATVGGSISSNTIGLGSTKWGQAGDAVVSLEVVLPTGEVLRTGTAANPKAPPYLRYVVGPDLTGIFCGDHGIFGVKTKATIKIQSPPKAIGYSSFGFSDLGSAVKAFWEIQKTQLAEDMVILCDRKSIEQILPEAPQVFEGVEALFVFIVQAPDEGVCSAIKDYLDSLAVNHGGRDLGEMFPKTFWESKYEMITPLFEWGMWTATCHALPTLKIPEATREAITLFKEYRVDELGMNYIATAMACGSNAVSYVAHTYFDPSDQEKRKIAEEIWTRRKRRVFEYGACPYWTGVGWYKEAVEYMSHEWHEALKKLKRALDPNNVMNPGAFEIWEV